MPPSRRQCSRGWASPGCRTGWWRRRLPMGHCSRCWRPALRCVSPSTRYGRRGRGCRKNAGGDRCPAGRAASYRNTWLAQRNNRHLWRRRFSDSVQATGALYAVASATRPSGTGGTAVQRAAGDTQYLRRPADVAVDRRVSTINCSSWACNPRAATAQARRDTPPAARRASACRPHRREPALPSGRSAAGVRFPATAAG